MKSRRYIAAAATFSILAFLALEAAGNCDLLLTGERARCTFNPVALLGHTLTSGRGLLMWLLLDALGVLGIYWSLFGRSYINYRSDMYEVVPGFKIPKPEGQGQHGTAWWMSKGDCHKLFQAVDTSGGVNLAPELVKRYEEEKRLAEDVKITDE